MTILTSDQRWLLYQMGGWQITNALLGHADHLWQSCWGGFNQTPRDGAPAWMTSFEVRAKQIVCPGTASGKDAQVTITPKQLSAYAKALPDDATAKLVAARTAARAEADRTDGWCWCGKPPGTTYQCAVDYLPASYHPSADETAAHYTECRRVHGVERHALAYALQLAIPDATLVPGKPAKRRRHTAAAWTTDQLALIADNPQLSVQDLADKLGRTPDAIRHKRRALTAIEGW